MPSVWKTEHLRVMHANPTLQQGLSLARRVPDFKTRNGPFESSLSLVFAAAFVVLAPNAALAADLFPRGPGFYFSIPKLLTLLIVYFCWVRTCWWVNREAMALKLPVAIWNPLVFGSGLVGLLVVWLLPWYWLASLPVLLALYLTPSLAYVSMRNSHVPPAQQVLTERHFKELAQKYLK